MRRALFLFQTLKLFKKTSLQLQGGHGGRKGGAELHPASGLQAGSCKAGAGLPSAQACFDAVAHLGFPTSADGTIENKTAADATQPAGCSFSRAKGGAGTATFNSGAPGRKSSAAAVGSRSSSMGAPLPRRAWKWWAYPRVCAQVARARPAQTRGS